ncbi:MULTISPECIES: cell wall anchor protein [Mesonia]|uniref:Uncharacterized protein n=1 Tax=Mesonia oceanica TaxID=2687242 RepID=A0AC61Y881_9FLAO|nr:MULTISPECIES: cell wall anchor protein [Mesonia]MAN27673.1 cell wall anchor protein [Mesonia sp.]MAQ40278.1 cell wall anchor protein [Mesonia sp.]MBJ97188.1 cell wall anchor protein [Flavobacteriaceae bacterium]VVV00709.1 hypothetical protein FVB9532_01983 [Mesonia oceanica]|tara:strand:- start:706 stop:2160 length:1455 start_codon:yes stop_codon:yes gene_type:complete
MKKIYFLILLIFNITVCKSQVGINTATPDASSALDIESTDGGILIPRMTTSQKTAIVDPANSLMLYDTDLKQYQYNEGTTSTPNWRAILSDAVKRDNYKVIKSTADLQDELVAGGGSSYLLSSNFFYEVSGTITIDYPIDINDAYLAGLDVGEDVLVNATGGTLFQSTSSGGSLRNLTLNGNNNQLFNVSGDGSQQFTFHTCIMAGASSVGSFSNLGLVFFDLIDFVNNTDGIQASNIGAYFFELGYWEQSNAGTFQELSGTFNDIQFDNGRIIVDTGEVGFDLSANPTVNRAAAIMDFVFDGAGTRINPYTAGTYAGFSFTKEWAVNCAGIPLESDINATGNIYYDGDLTTGYAISVSDNNAFSIATNGSTAAPNLFRFSSPQTGRLTYEGEKTRNFQVNASVSERVINASGNFYAFLIAKNGVELVESNSVQRIINDSDIQSVSITTTVKLDPGDYIEIYAERLSGGGTDTLVIFSTNLTIH